MATHPDPQPEVDALVDRLEPISSRDLPEIAALAEETDPGLVVSDQCDYSRYGQAWLSERLDLPGPDLGPVGITVNKKRLRRFLSGRGIPQPDHAVCRRFGQAREAAGDLGYPVVVKPVDNRGSLGVRKVASEEELHPAWLEAIARSHSREVILEEYIDGTVVTVDGAHTPDGHLELGIASKVQTDGAHPVALDIIYPAAFPEHVREKGLKRAHQVGQALAAEGATGLTHTEFVYDGEEFYLLESANRGGGVHTSDAILPAHAGFPTNEFLLAEARGQPAPVDDVQRGRNVVLLKFFELPRGTVEDWSGFDQATASSGVRRGRMIIDRGDDVGSPSDATERCGFLLVEGDGREEVRQRFQDAIDHLDVHYVSGDGETNCSEETRETRKAR